jgi:dTDP-4-amino-4,6-dideoxygalactose transaminase
MEPIQFVDLYSAHQIIKEKLFLEIKIAFNNTHFSTPIYSERLEKSFSIFNNSKYSIAVNNGTSALHLALLTLGISEGDEVIVPSNTYIASVWGILYLKAIPIFVDCRADTYNIDYTQIENKITSKTKAIIGVHLYGQPCDIDQILKICKKYNLKFIEDASQAHGALYKNKRVGNFGNINCFSLYPSKNLGTYGEGGIITTSQNLYHKKLLAYRNQGQYLKYKHELIGYNYRLASVEAITAEIKLKYLDKWNNQRIKIAAYYLKHITNKKIKLPYINDDSKHVFHLFVIQTKNRNQFIKYLNSKNIPTQIHYPIPCHLQKALSNFNYQKGDFPITEYHAKTCVSLPMHPFISTEQLKYIVDTINLY